MADTPLMITFVCWGNICRSPAARMVMEKLVSDAGLASQIVVDSSGTGSWHLGNPADRNTVRVADERGYDSAHSAKQFQVSDFDVYDYIVALDRDRADDLRALARTSDEREKISLLRSYDPDLNASDDVYDLDVPDPYGYGKDLFEEVFDQVEAACTGLLNHLRTTHNL